METITISGTIYFDPKDVTTKHKSQSTWKKMAMVLIDSKLDFNKDGEPIKGVSEYYSWFIKKRFGIELTKPLRGAHISFINDSVDEMTQHCDNRKEKEKLWLKVKKKYHKKKISIVLDLKPHIETPHWWLIVPHSERGELQAIRDELGFINRKTGLSKPYFGMHMTIGSAVDKKPIHKNDGNGISAKKMNLEQTKYIKGLIDKGFIKF